MVRLLYLSLLLLACLAYATLRYVVFKGDPPAHLPLYVSGKAVALGSLVLLGVASASRDAARRRWAGEWAITLAGLHAVMVLPVLRPAYLSGLFVGPAGREGFSGAAELGLLAGAIALVALIRLTWGRRAARLLESAAPWARGRVAGALVLGLIAVHGLAMGWTGWWSPHDWPGGMPPITLLSTLYACGAAALALARRQA